MLAATSRADAQPAIANRVVAAKGNGHNSAWPVWEPEIAPGSGRVIGVYIYNGRGAPVVGYATAINAGSAGWSWQTLADERVPNLGTGFIALDPSVAYDEVNGGFIVAALVNGTNLSRASVIRYDSGWASSWTSVFSGGGFIVDKPYLITGTSSQSDQEFYLVWLEEANNYRYARSLDGGATWVNDQIKVGGVAVSGNWSIHPAYADATTIYGCYTSVAGGGLGLLRGDDNASGGVDWTRLQTNASGSPEDLWIEIDKLGGLDPLIPGGVVKMVKNLGAIVVDPTNTNRIFVVYHDLAANSTTDLDIYCTRLDKNTTTGYWSAAPRVVANVFDAPPEEETDQFNPAACMDSSGRLHVLFMDDRNYAQADDATTPKSDAYYAISNDQGATWSNYKLRDAMDTPAFDESLWPANTGEFGEYMGIKERAGTVWTIFPGTLSTDTGHKSVIWSARIVP